MSDAEMLDALRSYVNEFPTYTRSSAPLLTKLIETKGVTLDKELTVYRGQPDIRSLPKAEWFSASEGTNVVHRYTGVKCCVFRIHLPAGTRILSVNDTLQDSKYQGEQEILVLAKGGQFTEPSLAQDRITDKDTYDVSFTPSTTIRLEKPPAFTMTISKTEPNPYGVLVGRRRRTRRWKMPRKMSRKYCKQTPCRKMGFTQRSSCRPYKNCFTRKSSRRIHK